ncbi:MAG: hypothetical protein ABR954_05065 [Dehalococcoidales bacterium]
MVTINAAPTENKIRFHWKYVILPVVLFALSIILAACFYPFLSPDIAYHFQGDTPDRWLARGGFIAWMLIPQVVFTLLSLAVVRLAMLASRYLPGKESPLKDILLIMGNMMALPQLVIIFAMIDFFLYNAYQIKLIPLWVFTLIILVLGAIILAILFIRASRRARRQQAKTSQE